MISLRLNAMAQVYVPKNTFADSGAAIEEADGDPRFSQGGQGPRQNPHGAWGPADETSGPSAVVGRGQDAPGMGHVAPLRLMGNQTGISRTLDPGPRQRALILVLARQGRSYLG